MKNFLIKYFAVILMVKIIAANLTECQHEKNEEILQFQQEFQNFYFNDLLPKYENINNLRRLQNLQDLQNLRVTLDFSFLDNLQLGITEAQKSYIKKISNIAASFIQKLIKVNPIVGKNIYGSKLRCIDLAVPQIAKDTGIENSDLNLYITYFNSGSSALANAASCFINPIYQRPTYGRISFNIGYLVNTNPNQFKFQLDLQVLLHEIIHVLGFSGDSMQYWIDPETKKPYKSSGLSKINTYQTIRGLKTLVLTSKNVANISKKYYNCSSIIGMQIENQGGSGSAGSHWERTVIMNELMTAQQVSIGAIFSPFTIALLKDTGFWADVNSNLAGQIYWGKDKGCDFFNLSCQSTQKLSFNEFVSSQQTEGCSFLADGFGKGVSDGFSECYYLQPYGNALCTDPTNQKNTYTDTKLENYSTNSRCFISSIIKPGTLGSFSAKNRCHESQCSYDFSSITVFIKQLGITIFCDKPGLIKEVNFNGKKIGDIQCPKDFYYFCSNNQQCNNNCNSNGLCVNKVCHCGDGYAGSDCSQACTKYIENGSCVTSCSQGNFANPDNTCKSTCPDGYFGDTSNNLCLQCDYSCNQCSGLPISSSSSKFCTKCSFFRFLLEGNCLDNCPLGYFEDPKTNECKKCGEGCLSCSSQEYCIQCDQGQGFQLIENVCSNLKCDELSNCSACSSSPQNCTQCKIGYFLHQSNCVKSDQCGQGMYPNYGNKKCENCQEGCSNCSNSSSCDQCQDGYRISHQLCTNCIFPCKNCDQINKSKCLSCDSGYYLTGSSLCVNVCPKGTFADSLSQKCLDCSKGCIECQNLQECIQCDVQGGYKMYDSEICVQENDCFSPCSTCKEPFNPKMCTTCQNSYILQGNSCVEKCLTGYFKIQEKQGAYSCQKCSNECQACQETSSYCIQCHNGKVLINHQCLSECPQGYIKTSSNVCQPTFNDTVENSSLNLTMDGYSFLFSFGIVLVTIIN